MFAISYPERGGWLSGRNVRAIHRQPELCVGGYHKTLKNPVTGYIVIYCQN